MSIGKGLPLAVLAALMLACGGGDEGSGGAADTASYACQVDHGGNGDLGNDFTGNYIKIHGKRSPFADAKYPCLNEFEVCLPLDADGRTEWIKDLCPSDDAPEGAWSFEYAFFTDNQCKHLLDNIACPVLSETLTTGRNENHVACTTDNAKKSFDFCIYDPHTGAGLDHCPPTVWNP